MIMNKFLFFMNRYHHTTTNQRVLWHKIIKHYLQLIYKPPFPSDSRYIHSQERKTMIYSIMLKRISVNMQEQSYPKAINKPDMQSQQHFHQQRPKSSQTPQNSTAETQKQHTCRWTHQQNSINRQILTDPLANSSHILNFCKSSQRSLSRRFPSTPHVKSYSPITPLR